MEDDDFDDLYGIMAGYDSQDEAQLGGFSEERWEAAMEEARRRGLA